MATLTPEKFAALLKTSPLDQVVHEHIFEGSSFVFRSNPRAEELLRHHLSTSLSIPPDSIRIVGSAKVGFSLSPDTFPRPFSDSSDIDVLVVDQLLFDRIWLGVLRWHYPRKGAELHEPDKVWMLDRRRAIYWGYLRPGEIKYEGIAFPAVLAPVRDISFAWFDAFKTLSLYPEFSARETSGILYRTWEHATLYHVNSLAQIRRRIPAG